jgi:hypothetical protein
LPRLARREREQNFTEKSASGPWTLTFGLNDVNRNCSLGDIVIFRNSCVKGQQDIKSSTFRER